MRFFKSKHKRRKSFSVTLVKDSPLRRLDPRTKIFLCLCLSLTVMLPLYKVIAAFCVFAAIIVYSGLLKQTLEQIYRILWILVILFVVDWLVVSPELAVIIIFRLTLMVGVFTIFFSTTTSTELEQALQSLGVPYRYAFSLSLAFQSINILGVEWRTIQEAQKARGIHLSAKWTSQFREKIRELVAFTVPAIVLTTRRAWAVTEAAYARGYDSPIRKSYRRLTLKWQDWLVIVLSLVFVSLFYGI